LTQEGYLFYLIVLNGVEGVAALYGGWYGYGLGAPYPPSPIFVVNVVKRGDNPLSKVYKKNSRKNFWKI
jgi:hypothetical protein